MPVYRLKNTPLKEVIRGGEAMHDGKITLHLEGRGEILLQQYFYNPEPGADVDRAAQVDWDYVAGRQVALGWLAGATNLLLVSWRDLSESHGTGRFVMQWYLVAQVEPGMSSVLLKKMVYSDGNPREVYHNTLQSGIGSHYISFDATKRLIIDRMTFQRELEVGRGWSPPPLYHESIGNRETPRDLYVADIRETIFHRYRYKQGKLESAGVEMLYTTQEFDSPCDIAGFYFGPLAPASVILKANPELRAKFSKDPGYEGGWFHFPAGIPIRIPLPEEWIIRFYEE